MRAVLLVCTLLWLANNILSGSIGGTLLESVIALANISTIIRLTSSQGQESAAACKLRGQPVRLENSGADPNGLVLRQRQDGDGTQRTAPLLPAD
jgi:hypothetical protein